MRPEKLTQKAREALVDAQSLASENGQQVVELQHLLLALMRQEGGVVPALLEKIGGDSVAEVRRNLDAYLAAVPELLR